MKTILHNDDSYNLAPIKYHFAWDHFNKSLNNFWTPNQIPVGRSLLDYNTKLTPYEKEVFKRVFSVLTTQDICVGKNLNKIAMCVGAPEISGYIAYQKGQEAVHSMSYQYTIEHLQMDEDEVYNYYKTNPAVQAKFNVARDMSEYFDAYTRTGDIPRLLYGLIFFYLCFEGGWFYNGFSPIFSLARRNLMTEASEQLQYIMRDEAGHMAFGRDLIRAIMQENVNQAQFLNVSIVHEIVQSAVSAEQAYIESVMDEGPILGYDAKGHVRHLKNMMDNRLKSIGLPPVFNEQPAFTWVDEMVNIKKEKNFFETHVTEYQVGAKLFGDDSLTSIDELLGDR